MNKKILIILILFTLSRINYIFACTIFNIKQNDKIIVGNNEDWKYSCNVKVWYRPGTNNSYGRICFGWNQLYFFRVAQGGMNEKGLFFDWASCTKSKKPKFSFKKKLITVGFPEKILKK